MLARALVERGRWSEALDQLEAQRTAWRESTVYFDSQARVTNAALAERCLLALGQARGGAALVVRSSE